MRAILIVLVIFVHISIFKSQHPEVQDATVRGFLNPAFTFLAGYLVNVNKTIRKFLRYLIHILLPYVIMVTGYMILSLYLPVNDGVESFDVPTVCRVLLLEPIGPYWFLHMLLVCGPIYYATFNALSKRSVFERYCIFLLCLLAVAYYTPLINGGIAIMYALGVALRIFMGDMSRIKATLWTLPVIVLMLLSPDCRGLENISQVIYVPCFLSLAMAMRARTNIKLARVMEYVGRNTMPIYIFHPIFTMMAKYFYPLFAFDGTMLLYVIFTLLLSVTGSIAIGIVLDKTRLSYVFGQKALMR